MHVSLGDLPTWLGGVGTVGALSVGVYQLREFRQDRERQQASQVSAWISAHRLSVPDDKFQLDLVVSFRNSSSQPISRVHYQVVVGRDRRRLGIGPLPPDGVTLERKVPFTPETTEEANSDPALDIWFIDSSGRHWYRDPTGQLKPEPLPADWLELRIVVLGPDRRDKASQAEDRRETEQPDQ